jgi:SAM-dependent methyltransferase
MKPQYGGNGPKRNRPPAQRGKGPFGPRGGSAVGPGLAEGGGPTGGTGATASRAPGPFVKTGKFNKPTSYGKPVAGGKSGTFGNSSAYAATPRTAGPRPSFGAGGAGGGGGSGGSGAGGGMGAGPRATGPRGTEPQAYAGRRPTGSGPVGANRPPVANRFDAGNRPASGIRLAGKPVGAKPGGAKPPGAKSGSKQGTGMPSVAAKTDWADVADWYDKLVGDQGSEYHQKVVFPGVLRLLAAGPGDAVLDVACGQGALCRLLAAKGVEAVGVDSAEPLVAAARARGPETVAYHVGDVREGERMPFLAAGHFAGAACVLAIQNIHPLAGVFAGVAKALRTGGRFVLVMMHPCFRGPKETGWMWDETAGVQFRRVDRYLTPRKEPIVTHPGSDPGGYTWTFHKPLEQYVKAARGAGLLVDAIEEWPSHKTSQPGPRAAAENRAREEIPMFMAIRCVKVPKADAAP